MNVRRRMSCWPGSVYAAAMAGGVFVRKNLLCVTWSAAQGHVFLFDLLAGVRVSAWTLPAGADGFSDAAGVAIDEHFHLFVADPHNDRVRHFSAFGRHLGDLGTSAAADGDVGRDRPGVLHRPRAVVLVGDEVLVAQGDRPRRRAVQRFSRAGLARRPLPSGGDVEATFAAPQAIAADAAGIYVADTGNGRIQRFRRDGTFVAHVPCGSRDVVARPIAVLPLPDGHFLLIDRGDEPGLFVLSTAGVRRAAGELATRCEAATALCRDEAGRIYVLDQGGERVQRFSAALAFEAVVVDLAEHLDDYSPTSSHHEQQPSHQVTNPNDQPGEPRT